MSVPTSILSSAVPFAVSADGGVTFKFAVCKKTWGYTGSATLVEEETDCDVLTAVGAIKNSFTLELVLNTTPNGSTELASDALMNYFQNKTQLVVKLSNGSTFYRSIAAYISAYAENAPQGGMVNATVTFNGSGTLDTTL
jgi:hypothetical protein